MNINSLSKENIAKLKQYQINDIDFYAMSNLDLNLRYNQTHFIVSNDTLYVFDTNFDLLNSFSKQEITGFKIDSLLSYGRLYLIKDEKYYLIGCFKKEQTSTFLRFEKLGSSIFDKAKTNKEINDNRCPYCHSLINPKKGYCTKCYGKTSVLFRLLKYGKNYQIIYISMILLFVVTSLIALAITALTNKILYNEILNVNGKWYGKIMLFVCAFLILEILLTTLQIIYERIVIKASAKLSYEIKMDVFNSLSRLPLSFFSNKQTGSLMNRIIYDVNQIYYYIIGNVPNFIINLTKAVVLFVYLLISNVSLTLLSLSTIPLLIVLFVWFFPRMSKRWEQHSIKNNAMTSIVTDTIEGFKEVKVFSNSQNEIERFNRSSNQVKDSYIRTRRFRQIFYPIIMYIISFSVLILWYFGGRLVIDNKLEYGDFALFVAGLEMLFSPLESLISFIFQETPRIISSGRRIFEIKDANNNIIEKDNAINLNNIKGDIEFDDVSFAYENNKEVLKNISFKVKANTSLGIVGKTGAGKTTIVNLLTRLYDIESGNIKIDDINIKDVTLKSLHQNVALISQDIYLFNESIFENVRYGKPDATYEEVIDACKKANAHDFIINLANGYDSIIGSNGIDLSGGERQRIAIARAILLDPKIIIFDEATSAMDTITERKIQDSINNLANNKTLIVVAHRLSTLKDIDNIIVIDNKTIIEQGTPEELIKQNGRFKQMYDIQQQALQHIRIGDEYDGLSKMQQS